jgi:hypothetical protein
MNKRIHTEKSRDRNKKDEKEQNNVNDSYVAKCMLGFL